MIQQQLRLLFLLS